jgi:beta-phosphoglucomutase family hydrolase
MSLKAVLWDLDGVITDSGEYHYQSWVRVFTPMGIQFSKDTFNELFGMNNTTMLSRYFDPEREAELMKEVAAKKEKLYKQVFRGQLQLLPGVLNWLTYFQEHGIRQAVASSAPADNIEPMIAELGIRHYFEALVSGEKIAGKPAPDVFLLAAKKLESKPEDCLVIEDSTAGLEAAERAGMRSVAVQTTNPPKALQRASLIVNRLSDLDPSLVESQLWPEIASRVVQPRS